MSQGVEIIAGPPRFTLEQIRREVAAACGQAGAERAVLFGSYARGDADAHSDVDLLIVCETDVSFFERRSLFPGIFRAFPGCDLLVYTPAEIDERREAPGVIGEALRTGVAVYERARPSDAG